MGNRGEPQRSHCQAPQFPPQGRFEIDFSLLGSATLGKNPLRIRSRSGVGGRFVKTAFSGLNALPPGYCRRRDKNGVPETRSRTNYLRELEWGKVNPEKLIKHVHGAERTPKPGKCSERRPFSESQPSVTLFFFHTGNWLRHRRTRRVEPYVEIRRDPGLLTTRRGRSPGHTDPRQPSRKGRKSIAWRPQVYENRDCSP